MFIYQAHAETLHQFLDGLDLHKFTSSPPGSALFFEYYSIGEDIYVKMLFKEDIHSEEVLFFPEQYEEFIKLEAF